jgi:hypothetical protein
MRLSNTKAGRNPPYTIRSHSKASGLFSRSVFLVRDDSMECSRVEFLSFIPQDLFKSGITRFCLGSVARRQFSSNTCTYTMLFTNSNRLVSHEILQLIIRCETSSELHFYRAGRNLILFHLSIRPFRPELDFHLLNLTFKTMKIYKLCFVSNFEPTRSY